MNIEVNADTAKVDKMLADFPAALARAQRQALKDIGQDVVSRATQAFRTPQLRPAPWAPRKPSKRDNGHPLLIKSGILRRSIEWKFNGVDTVIVGSDKKYAGYHQFGTRRMPARPFMPLDANGNLTPQMAQKVNRFIEKALSDELAKIIKK